MSQLMYTLYNHTDVQWVLFPTSSEKSLYLQLEFSAVY